MEGLVASGTAEQDHGTVDLWCTGRIPRLQYRTDTDLGKRYTARIFKNIIMPIFPQYDGGTGTEKRNYRAIHGSSPTPSRFLGKLLKKPIDKTDNGTVQALFRILWNRHVWSSHI